MGSAGEDEGPEERIVRALDLVTGKIKLGATTRLTSLANGNTGLLATAVHLVLGGTGGLVFAIDSTTGLESCGGSSWTAVPTRTNLIQLGRSPNNLISGGRALFEFGL